jgi:hypothetical protein
MTRREIKAAYVRLAELGEQLDRQINVCAAMSQIRYPLFDDWPQMPGGPRDGLGGRYVLPQERDRGRARAISTQPHMEVRCSFCGTSFCPVVWEKEGLGRRYRSPNSFTVLEYQLGRTAVLYQRFGRELGPCRYGVACSEACEKKLNRVWDQMMDRRQNEWRELQEAKALLNETKSWLKDRERARSRSEASAQAASSPS